MAGQVCLYGWMPSHEASKGLGAKHATPKPTGVQEEKAKLTHAQGSSPINYPTQDKQRHELSLLLRSRQTLPGLSQRPRKEGSSYTPTVCFLAIVGNEECVGARKASSLFLGEGVAYLKNHGKGG